MQSFNKIWIQKRFPQAVCFITFVREEERATQFGVFRSNRKKFVKFTGLHIDTFFPKIIHLHIFNFKILIDIKNYVHTPQANFYVPYKDKLLNNLVKK